LDYVGDLSARLNCSTSTVKQVFQINPCTLKLTLTQTCWVKKFLKKQYCLNYSCL